DAAGIKLGRRTEAEVEVQIGRDALALDVIVAIIDLFGRDPAVIFVPAVSLDIVGLELALIIGKAARHADIVAKALREIDAALRRQLFRIIIIAALDLRGEQILAAFE